MLSHLVAACYRLLPGRMKAWRLVVARNTLSSILFFLGLCRSVRAPLTLRCLHRVYASGEAEARNNHEDP